jgi:hypothetical protein
MTRRTFGNGLYPADTAPTKPEKPSHSKMPADRLNALGKIQISDEDRGHALAYLEHRGYGDLVEVLGLDRKESA